MDIGFLNDYLVLVVLGICLCVGYVLKNLVPSDNVNKYIPLIMAALGLVLNMWMNGWALTPDIMLGGLFTGLASTGLYEAFRNLINRGK